MLLIGRFVQEQLQVLSSIIKIEVTKFTFLNVVFFSCRIECHLDSNGADREDGPEGEPAQFIEEFLASLEAESLSLFKS